MNQIEYRKSDHAIVGMYGIREYAPGFTAEERAWNFLNKHFDKLGLQKHPEAVLRHHFTRRGKDQSVVRYRQMHNGIPVDENEIVITINAKGEVTFLINTTRPLKSDFQTIPKISEKMAISKALAYYSLRHKPADLTMNRMVHFINNRPLLCYKLNFTLTNPSGAWVSYVDAQNGAVVEVYDNMHYQCAPSGNATGNVFLPDPISTSGATYGTGGFSHNNDVNHPDLDAQLRTVIFQVGTQLTGPSRLRGEYAYYDLENCTGSGTNWQSSRSEDCFEEVMCYYHISQNMCYYYEQLDGNAPTQFSGFDKPNAPRFTTYGGLTGYNSTSGVINIGTYTNPNDNTIEAGEDAAVIIHELGHGINDWMTGGGLSDAEGLKEGFADYWAQSYIRNFGLWKEFEPEYQWAGHWFMFTTELPDEFDRTTDFVVSYPDELPGDPSGHADGQLFATAMMRIWDDIGKLKTDAIAIDGIAMTVAGTTQSVAAECIYGVAVAKGYSIEELCIIYGHFKEIYKEHFNPQPPNGTQDYYLRDTPDDLGAEPNTTTAPIWLSEDIWVRQQNDGLTVRGHQNAQYGITNYIYVRVRSRNCFPVTDGELWVYFSKASTWLEWPLYWINYEEPTSNGPVLAGDIVPGSPFTIPDDLQAGEDWIIEIPWTNMPNPADFDIAKQHFCLLARIVSGQDPIGVEVPEVGQNVKNYNNIAWKNLTILEDDPFAPPSGAVSVRAPGQTGANQILVETPELPGNIPCPDQGAVQIELEGGLDAVWSNNGEQGSGFVLESGGELSWTGTTMSIEGLYLLPNTPYALVATYLPDPGAQECSFDVIHIDPLGNAAGGERFTYTPTTGGLFSEGALERAEPESVMELSENQRIRIYPVPVQDYLQVQISEWEDETSLSIYVFDVFGKLRLRQVISNYKNFQLDVSSLSAGLYLLQCKSSAGEQIPVLRFIKL